MNNKVITFAIIMETPVPDKNKIKDILLGRGYALKYYDMGLMVAYDKDGKKIENKLESDPQAIEKYSKSDMYQLKGKYCTVDFSRENPIILHQFGTKTEQCQYDFAKNLEEAKSVIGMLNQFANYGVSPSELLVSLRVKGRQNPDATLLNMSDGSVENFTVKDTTPYLKNHPAKFPEEKLKRNHPPSPAEHLEVHYVGTMDSKSRNTEAVIRARSEKYLLTLRFSSAGAYDALHDLARCGEFSSQIIEKLEPSVNWIRLFLQSYCISKLHLRYFLFVVDC